MLTSEICYILLLTFPHPSLRRSYTCPVCARVFACAENLKVHERRHDPDKRMSCPYCEKFFFRRTKLREHINIHTGERPSVCPAAGCGKSFTSSSSLAHHKKSCAYRKRSQQQQQFEIQLKTG